MLRNRQGIFGKRAKLHGAVIGAFWWGILVAHLGWVTSKKEAESVDFTEQAVQGDPAQGL